MSIDDESWPKEFNDADWKNSMFSGPCLEEKEWVELIKRIHAESTGRSYYSALCDAYSEIHRHYHNLDHIYQCITEFRSAPYLSRHPNEIEMAIWFHDAVYILGRKDNEQKSAELAREFLKEAKMPDFFINKVYSLILATKHDKIPVDLDAKVIADIDLSILGKGPAEFYHYESGIRHEYDHIPEKEFRQRRAAVLKKFLGRDSIYCTDYFKQKYEEQARENLQRSIERLDMKIPEVKIKNKQKNQ